MRVETCAPLQERMWLLDKLVASSGPAFNLCTATRLRGPVDRDALAAALNRLVDRHESLRTHFEDRDGRPVRVVAEPGEVTVNLSADAVGLDDAAMFHFDLARAPLMRAWLVTRSPGETVLILCLSHAVADGWSMGILHRELGQLYAGESLPDLGYDVGQWIRSASGSADDLRYWRDTWAGAPESLDLPTDRPRPATETYAGARVRRALPDHLNAGVHHLARTLRVTPFIVHTAAFAMILARLTGQSEVVIGTPWANRRSVAQEGVVGPLMDLLPLRIGVDGGGTVQSLLRDIRKTTLNAISHSAVGFEQLVSALRPARQAGMHPLFQAMILMQNAPLAPVSLPGCECELLEVMPPTSRLDLGLDISSVAASTVATFEYRTDLFEAQTVEALADGYVELLGAIVTRPEALTGDLGAAAFASRPSAGATRVWEGPQTLHGLVDRAAASWPDAIAVGDLTYAELTRLSIGVARRLVAEGIRPGDVVGVQMDRSTEQIVAVMAVMRAGAAYVPMDPQYPRQRLDDMARDAGVSRVIQHLPAASTVDVELPQVSGQDTAYVFYTSGSTGRPKGVIVSHGAVANIVAWGQEQLPLRPGDRMLGKTPFTFDISVWEIFGTLAAGATLVLAEPGRHRDSSYVADMIAHEGITVTHFVPSMLRGVLSLPDPPVSPTLRLIIAGGEALPAELAQRSAALYPVPTWNFYGPTEATVYVSAAVAGGRISANGTVPIGEPVANTSMYVLDQDLRPVAAGAHGELYLGGVQVAQGYHNRPGLTATRFLPDPFSSVPGARMYRTGDIARRAGDGAIDFLGRADGQIKLRGFRIELGEIEAGLMRHPAVTMAAAYVSNDVLAAQVVTRAPVTPAQLRDHLSARLPAYMVPVLYGQPDRLPLTTSGKLDRNRLALMPLDRSQPETTEARSPRGPAEQAIAQVWTEMLGVGVTDANADFFALGGDSISAVAVVSGCARRGWSVRVQQVFEHATIAELALVAVPCPIVVDDAEPVAAMTRTPQGILLPLGPMQQYAVDRVRAARLPGLYVVCFTAAIDGDSFDPVAWRATWQELMRRHGGLRTSFRTDAPVQLVHDELPLPFTETDLRHLDRAAALSVVAEAENRERWHVIDIEDAPQWAMKLYRVGDDQWRVICRLSYLLQDGWSVSVLQDEWYPLYDAYRQGRIASLPAPPTPYSVHLGHLARRDLAAGRRYWSDRITVARQRPAVTEVLRARCTPGGPPDHQTVPRWLTAEQEKAIRDFAGRERVALFAVLQGAWALLICGLTGQREVLFGTISSGRSTSDVTRTYGSFNNMMPTQVHIDPAQSVSGFLHALQAMGVEDRDNDHVPLPVIAADLGLREAVNLVDTYIVHENFPIDTATQTRFARWKPDISEMRTEHALRMLIWPVGELSFHLSFDARMLSASDAEILMDHYVSVMERMAAGHELSTLVIDPLATMEHTR